MSSTNAFLTGIVTDIFAVETRPNFSKRVFWLKEPDRERHPQHWELELHQQDIERLKGIQIGDTIKCEVEVRGVKWKKRDGTEKLFNALKVVGIELLDQLVSQNPPPQQDLPF